MNLTMFVTKLVSVSDSN